MSSPGLLCLKWNNHTSSFDKLLNNIHLKDVYSDGTIVCHGKFYPVHRFVLSTCSDYFEEIFRQSINLKSKHPFIIVKDIHPPQMEALLNYMYRGEVNVPQEMLPDLIKAAEAFKIKGLAVSDEEPPLSKFTSSRDRKRSSATLTSPSSQVKKSRKVDYNLESGKISSKSTDEIKHGEEMQTERVTSMSKNCLLNSTLKDAEELFIPEIQSSDVKSEPSDPLDYIETEEVAEETSPSGEAYLSPKEEKSFESESYASTEPFPPYEDNENPITDENYDLAQSTSWDNSQGFEGDSNLEESDAAQGMADNDNGPSTSSFGSSENLPMNPEGVLAGCSLQSSHRCPHCSYVANKLWKLTKHLMTHTGEKPYHCNLCPYKSIQKVHLQNHLLKHSGEKAFSCPFCPYKANLKYHLKSHMVYKHSYFQ